MPALGCPPMYALISNHKGKEISPLHPLIHEIDELADFCCGKNVNAIIFGALAELFLYRSGGKQELAAHSSTYLITQLGKFVDVTGIASLIFAEAGCLAFDDEQAIAVRNDGVAFVFDIGTVRAGLEVDSPIVWAKAAQLVPDILL